MFVSMFRDLRAAGHALQPGAESLIRHANKRLCSELRLAQSKFQPKVLLPF